MNNSVKNLIIFGVPIIALAILMYSMFFAKSGDPEFGAIGKDVAILILLAGLLILYFIAGITFWAITKKSFIFQSSIFSIIVVSLAVFIPQKIRSFKNFTNDMKRSSEMQNKRQNNIIKMDSLNQVIKNEPLNYEAIDERALFYRKSFSNLTIQEQYDKSVEYFEHAILHKSSNINIYKNLSIIYNWNRKYSKSINVYETALKYDSLKEISLSENDKNFILDEIKKSAKLLEEDKLFSKEQLIKAEKGVENLTAKFKAEGYTSKYLVERARFYSILEKNDESLADCNHAIKLDPNNRSALALKPAVLRNLKRYDEALVNYRIFIDKYPDSKKLIEEHIYSLKKEMSK